MKEFGGYIELEHYNGSEYHSGYKLDSVRSALSLIISLKQYQHVLIPYYICSCISELFDMIGIDYSYYHIDDNFHPILDEYASDEHTCLLLVNYFGQLESDYVKEIAKNYNIFLDNTQAFFLKKIDGIDMANSCRKFLGVTGGGYLYTDFAVDISLYPYDHSYNRLRCLVGRLEESASEYYKYFVENEEVIRGCPCKRMSKFDENILRSIDYEEIIKKRTNNYNYLDRNLQYLNKLTIKNHAGLFMYPLLLKNGLNIKKYLIAHKVYVPTLWPGVDSFTEINEFERNLVENLVLLPIDQRYGIEDMQYMLETLKDYYNNN